MIEINLLPQELKPKVKKKILGIESEQAIYIIPLVFGILIILHILLGGILLLKNSQLKLLNIKWRSLETQRKNLEDFQKECALLSADAKVTQQLLSSRINWSEKLYKLSLYLPSGVWFNELSVTSGDFILQASVISLQKEELGLIHQFIDKLKNDHMFFKDFNSLELKSVERRVIGGYDVLDFVLVGTLK
jgi:Tfp pilus assembly protein PilN